MNKGYGTTSPNQRIATEGPAGMSRRQFGLSLAAASLPTVPAAGSFSKAKQDRGWITDLPGIEVGHSVDSRRPTGCTVILCRRGAVCGVDIRGSAPGTRETALLDPVNTIQKVHAVVLSGGSAYGLDTAGGVMQFLEERGIGFPVRAGGVVPIVPAAILYDLGVGNPSIRPDRESGYRACQAARTGPIEEGNVGAGAGATVGKMFGPEHAMKSGLGTASIRVEKLVVGAIVAVNAVGDVIDPANGSILAGARDEEGFINTAALLKRQKLDKDGSAGEHTTIGAVATNAGLNKSEATKIAQMAHDGLARSINPVHLPMDGDTIFALATSEIVFPNLSQIGALAAEAMSLAVIRAVMNAKGIPGYPAARDLIQGKTRTPDKS